jgi:hypothetical protein
MSENAWLPVNPPAPEVAPGPAADLPAPVEPAPVPADVPVAPVAPDPAPVDSDPVPDAQDPAQAAPVEPASSVVAPPGGKVVALPSGFHVALRNPSGIRARERQFIYDGMDLDSIGSPGEKTTIGNREAVMTGVAMSQRIIALLVSAWDVQAVNDALVPFGPVLPLPKDDLDTLADMPVGDIGVLEKEADVAQKIIMPDFSPNPSEASPTLPSAG